MSLKKKIFLSFFISASIIAVLVAIEYLNFIEIRKEIRYLELSDTIRSKSLQLRRHEKNFFLYGHLKGTEESAAIQKYLAELDAIIAGNIALDKTGELRALRERIHEYGQRFERIKLTIRDLSAEFERVRPAHKQYERFFPFIGSTFLDRPLQAAEFLGDVFRLPDEHKILKGLRDLDSEINELRKSGEDVLTVAKEFDSLARVNAERFIYLSQTAILIFFPLFFLVGIGTLIFIGGNVVNRLRLLMSTVEKTGKGEFSHMSVLSGWGNNDEVGMLIEKFNNMEDQLASREEELERKNSELLQSKKLAAIGTLASGIAHELNNPLNNIYLSAQILERETKETSLPAVRETVNDILGQTVRVKRIVGDLLEFAKGKELKSRRTDLSELIMGAYKMTSTAIDTGRVHFEMEGPPGGVAADVDPEQMERVFINLFTNAVDAMSGQGELKVGIAREEERVRIGVTDSGKGIPADALEKIFEPFYTTKDRGTGLGLAIVFSIIRKHGGEIDVKSEEGRGTTFIISLPAEKES